MRKNIFILTIFLTMLFGSIVAANIGPISAETASKPTIKTTSLLKGITVSNVKLYRQGGYTYISYTIANHTRQPLEGAFVSLDAITESVNFGGGRKLTLNLRPGEKRELQIKVKTKSEIAAMNLMHLNIASFEVDCCDSREGGAKTSCEKHGGLCEFSCDPNGCAYSYKCCGKCGISGDEPCEDISIEI